jgi:hypothetical protein
MPPAGRRLAPQRTDRTGGWGQAACTAGAARGEAARGGRVSEACPALQQGNGVRSRASHGLLDRDGKELALRTSRINLTASGTDYEATATAMGRALEVLAQDMATTLRSMGQPAPTR